MSKLALTDHQRPDRMSLGQVFGLAAVTVLTLFWVVTAIRWIGIPVGVSISIGMFVALVAFIAMGYNLKVSLLMVAFLAEQYTADIDLGPVSIRVYLYIGILLLTLLGTLSSKHLIKIPVASQFIKIYIFLIVWLFLSSVIQGEAPFNTLLTLISGPALALVVFIITQSVLNDARSVYGLLTVMVVTSLLSAVTAILQWRNVSWAWDLAYTIWGYLETSRLVMLGMKTGAGIVNQTEAASWVPGLTMYSVNLNIQLISYGFLVLFWTWYSKYVKSFQKAFGMVTAVIAYGAIFISQQRAGIIAVPLVLIIWLIYEGREKTESWTWVSNLKRSSGERRNSRLVVVMIILAAIAITSWAYGQEPTVVGSGVGGYSLTRIQYIGSPRIVIARVALDVAQDNLLVGNASEYINQISSQLGIIVSPHNYFLNALTFNGVPGLILASLLLVSVFRLIHAALRIRQQQPEMAGIVVGLAFGLSVYTFNTQFHNASLLLGDTTMAWLLGCMCAISFIALRKRKNH